MKIFYILCACAVVSAAPNPGVTKEQLHDYPEVRALLLKQTGAHHLDKRLFLGSVFKAVSSFVGGAADIVSDVGSAVVDTVSDVGSAVGDAVSDVVENTVDVVSSVVDKAADAVADGVEAAVDNLGKAADAAVGGVKAVANDLVDGAKDAVGDLASAANNLGKAAESVVGGQWKAIENVGQAVTSGSLKEALQKLGEAAESAVGGVVDGVEHVGGAVADVAEGVVSGAKSLTKVITDFDGGVDEMCHYLVQGAQEAQLGVEHGFTDAVQSIPVYGELAAVAQEEMEKLRESVGAQKLGEKKCKEVILTYLASLAG